MNYRHAFHAGNFGDVLKHTALCLVLQHMRKKDSPFFVLDTHAGRGSYDLIGIEAEKTGEAKAGIQKLWRVIERAPEGFAPYHQLLLKFNSKEVLKIYPGSPQLTNVLLRAQDRALFYEKHPGECAVLQGMMRGRKNIQVKCEDGWAALKAKLPPKERRGLVLIDPPFEQGDEFSQILENIMEAVKRFANGIYLIWYPIKALTDRDRLAKQLRQFKRVDILRCELHLRKPNHPKRLDGAGLVVINPPWKFSQQLHEALGFLMPLFEIDKGSAALVEYLVRKDV